MLIYASINAINTSR